MLQLMDTVGSERQVGTTAAWAGQVEVAAGSVMAGGVSAPGRCQVGSTLARWRGLAAVGWQVGFQRQVGSVGPWTTGPPLVHSSAQWACHPECLRLHAPLDTSSCPPTRLLLHQILAGASLGAWLALHAALRRPLTPPLPSTACQILVGSSLGAWLALHAALRRPHLVVGLLLLAPAADISQHWREVAQPAGVDAAGHDLVRLPSLYVEVSRVWGGWGVWVGCMGCAICVWVGMPCKRRGTGWFACRHRVRR